MRLVAYLRVSSESQLDGYGLDVQRKAVKAWAKANGHTIVAEYVDEGVSGTLDALDRPGLSAALADLRKPPKADGLIVAKLDRLARALAVQEASLAVAWRSGASVFTADGGEVLRDDVDDPMRTAMRQMVGVFAELDRRTIVKRLKDGRTAKASAGKHAVGDYRYGTQGKDHDSIVNPAEAQAVAVMLDLARAGKSYREIARSLDAQGHKPRRAATWSAMSVRNIVTREAPALAAQRPPRWT